MSDYIIKQLNDEEFRPMWFEKAKKMFADEQIFRLLSILSEEERSKFKELEKNMGNPVTINLTMYRQDELVGWCWGYQNSADKFYMCNSAVMPEHRKQGVYTMLLNTLLKKAEDLGFQEVFSRHNTTNNAILIPKLKAGFVITGMEVSDKFGTLVLLSYFPNKTRYKVLDYRSGLIKPDDEIKKLLEL